MAAGVEVEDAEASGYQTISPVYRHASYRVYLLACWYRPIIIYHDCACNARAFRAPGRSAPVRPCPPDAPSPVAPIGVGRQTARHRAEGQGFGEPLCGGHGAGTPRRTDWTAGGPRRRGRP